MNKTQFAREVLELFALAVIFSILLETILLGFGWIVYQLVGWATGRPGIGIFFAIIHMPIAILLAVWHKSKKGKK